MLLVFLPNNSTPKLSMSDGLPTNAPSKPTSSSSSSSFSLSELYNIPFTFSPGTLPLLR